jgi:hypothetical protein
MTGPNSFFPRWVLRVLDALAERKTTTSEYTIGGVYVNGYVVHGLVHRMAILAALAKMRAGPGVHA